MHIHRRILFCFSVILHVFPFSFLFQKLLSVVLTSILLFSCYHLICVSLSSGRLLLPLYIFTTTPKSYVNYIFPADLPSAPYGHLDDQPSASDYQLPFSTTLAFSLSSSTILYHRHLHYLLVFSTCFPVCHLHCPINQTYRINPHSEYHHTYTRFSFIFMTRPIQFMICDPKVYAVSRSPLFVLNLCL